MPQVAEPDGSEDVNDFLQRIRELGDKRDKEDEERTRKLEEEILQGRKERQARRAERARSISPTKSSTSIGSVPAHSQALHDEPHSGQLQSNVDYLRSAPSRNSDVNNAFQGLNGTTTNAIEVHQEASEEPPQPPIKPSTLSNFSPSAAMPPSRAGTLSWQQRPTSRDSTSASARPLSVLASENNASRSPRATPEPASKEGTEMSNSQIAQSLSSKDASFFKQTADRGYGSAAYRKNQEDATMSSAERMRLPGLSRESTTEPVERKGSPAEVISSQSPPSREGSIQGGINGSRRFPSTASTASVAGLRSPLPTISSQRFDLPQDTALPYREERARFTRTRETSPSQSVTSSDRTDRPSSPTKGLGGFVQSAMLKRSDSVNKRWSAQVGPGLSRGNSIASNRSGYGGSNLGLATMLPLKDARPTSLSRDSSPTPKSRPGSGHSNTTFSQLSKENDDPKRLSFVQDTLAEDPPLSDSFMQPAFPQPDHVQPATSRQNNTNGSPDAEKSPPASPSKTMDQRRWSPVKPSWLESAINKPESPKLKAAPPQQPSWMTEISKVRQQRGSIDAGKGGAFKEVVTSGLMRSPPMGIDTNLPRTTGPPIEPLSSAPKEAEVRDTNKLGNLAKTKSLPANAPSSTAAFKQPVLSNDPPSNHVPGNDLGRSATSEDPSRDTSDAKMNNSPPIAPVQEVKSNSLKKDKPEAPTKKDKPETPPKKDFRSTLKPRQPSGGNKPHEEPEFKNVFGKLKRTQTQNYVAPDELKNNILRGKAGLALTGGPVKTERRDEFKENILKQKEAMKLGSPAINRKLSGDSVEKKDPPTPEAIARMKGLAKSDSTLSKGSLNNVTTPEAASRQQNPVDKPKTKSIPPEKQIDTFSSTFENKASNSALAGRFNPALAGLMAKAPSPMTASATPGVSKSHGSLSMSSTSIPSTNDKESDSGMQLTHMTKSRARGPKRRLPASTNSTSNDVGITSQKNVSPKSPKVPGSKDKANDVSHASMTASPSYDSNMTSARPLAAIINNNDKTAPVPSHRRLEEVSKDPNASVIKDLSSDLSGVPPVEIAVVKTRSSPIIKPKPSIELGNNKSRPPSVSGPRETLSKANSRSVSKSHQSTSSPVETQNSNVKRNEIATEADISVKGAAATWGQTSSHAPAQTRAPIRLPTKKDEEVAAAEAGLGSSMKSEPIGLGLQSVSVGTKPAAMPETGLPSPSLDSTRAPPKPAKKPESVATRIFSNGDSGKSSLISSASPIPQTSETRHHLISFFDSFPTSLPRISVDTQKVLSSHNSQALHGNNKIKTLRKQIWELSPSGKTIDVPSHQEHILFEGAMYLCSHVFGHPSTGTKTTEVYLWCGDQVSPSAIEDALLFARKAAKESGGTLLILRQGKETANFFQALGGIVITRRGSGGGAAVDSSSNAMYMLCGRQHAGQIAFDEVDFSPNSLCSGFPYIISARFGKLYLWKGRGSGADELGCARLIAMDLGLTGEIEEVDEGSETGFFWESFPERAAESRRGGPHEGNKDYWKLKPNQDKYATKLFSVEHEMRPKSSSGFKWGRRGSAPAEDATTTAQIRRINPFTQADLGKEGIFVLDAFFEIYVILTPRARSQPSPFFTALLFAEDYSILSASLEDRPFVPLTSVVLPSEEGSPVPLDLKSVFRKWDERSGPIPLLCKVLPLNAALEATRA